MSSERQRREYRAYLKRMTLWQLYEEWEAIRQQVKIAIEKKKEAK